MILKTDLMPHQQKAYDKLSKIKVGALYMEQGTGKTRTALELINKRLLEYKVDHILWLCPVSVKSTIANELKKHINEPHNEYFTICGIETLSSSIRTNVKLIQLVKSTSCYLIVDESNLVKNGNANRTESISYLSNFCTYKLILNGTPISKNEADLYSQWSILDWRILGYRSFWSFSNNHVVWDDNIKGKIKEIKNVKYLTDKIAPYTYQVLKEECLSLPSKSYSVASYHLTEEQYELYHYVAEKLLLEVDEMNATTIYRLFAGLQNVLSGFNINPLKKGFDREPFFKQPKDNPRIKRLLEVIDPIDQHKIVIFCKYTQEIHDICAVLNDRYGDDKAVMFNGEVKQRKRQQQIDHFYNDAQFFVANKTTAGYGLNLQFCHYAIYYNNDWDFATRSQSEDRIHRIGQDHNVHIIDIYAENTLDQRILKCLDRKENMSAAFKNFIDKAKDTESLTNWLKGWDDLAKSLHR